MGRFIGADLRVLAVRREGPGDRRMRVWRTHINHPIGHPWKWEAAGLIGYCITRMGALRAARRAVIEASRG